MITKCALGRAKLSDLCVLVTDGTHDTPKTVSQGVPLIKGKDISRGWVDFTTCDHVSLEDHRLIIKRSKAERGDTLFANIGNSLGDIAYVETDREFSIKNVALFKPNTKLALPRYLFYLLKSPLVQKSLLSQRAGAAQPFLGLAALRAFEVDYHRNLETQRRIASILGAYDDLIEVNRRRVAVLEEMARGLFEEWFVRSRFPGYETVPIVDTPDGPLPEGWAVNAVGDTFEMLGGGTPSKTVEAYWTNGTVDWFTPTDLTGARNLFMDRSSTRITKEGLARSSAKLFPADSIMMTSRATIGVISICTGSASTNQGFITCLPNARVPRSYLYYWLAQNVEVFIAHGTGATFKEITKGVFKRLPIVVPSGEVVSRFERVVRPQHDMILALERSNRSLASARDLLLPRLMSGQLSVEAAERELEEAA